MNLSKNYLLRAIVCALFFGRHLSAFVLNPHRIDNQYKVGKSLLKMSREEHGSQSFMLSEEEVGPALKLKVGSNGNDKIINAFGSLSVIVSLIVNPIWSLAMTIADKVDTDPNSNRAEYDFIGKIWARVYLTAINSFPQINGLENIDKAFSMSLPVPGDNANEKQGVLFVANHCSWLDIPVICCAIDPVFKFIAKGDLAKVPQIGQQLIGGKHVLIDREDRRSQLKTFKECINWLKSGVNIMAFPEGQRSPDGRLIDFKGGSFAMASKTGAVIVPITIANTHAVMPMNALFPVQPGNGKLKVIFHPPIDPADKTDTELNDMVRNAIISKLPADQVPILVETQSKEPVAIA